MTRTIRGRADARWLPSRRNFALFRLYAYLRLRVAPPEPRDVALFIDRNQTAAEHYSVAVWVLLTMTCYCAADLFESWPLPLAIVSALVVATLLTQVGIVGFGLVAAALTPRTARVRVNSFVLMLLFIAAAAWYARHPSWARFVAWQVLALVALNAAAAAIVFLLRGSIARLESAFGGVASAP
ncbi:MAG TPA: hypothetical protein VF824_00040 [Thermoanaerobaculia bacterium]|jgi:hypothetical protein